MLCFRHKTTVNTFVRHRDALSGRRNISSINFLTFTFTSIVEAAYRFKVNPRYRKINLDFIALSVDLNSEGYSKRIILLYICNNKGEKEIIE